MFMLLFVAIIQITLNNTNYLKHRLIALQWIENDDPVNKTEVDHRNKHRDDNHIDNLHWVTRSENNLNITGRRYIKYEYIDDIPDDSVIVDFYETRNIYHEFEHGRYYYYYDEETDEDIFYGKIDDDLYRRLHININKSGTQFVRCNDIDNKAVSIYINKFKRQHDLI